MVWLSLCLRFRKISLALSLAVTSIACFSFADVTFEKDEIELATKKIKVELAKSPDQHSQGLMYRKSLSENAGMLFIFPDEEPRAFWMKNTIIDLSIGFFDKGKKLIDVQEMKATSVLDKNLATYPSKGPAMFALEMPSGWFKKAKIKVGQRFRFVSPKEP